MSRKASSEEIFEHMTPWQAVRAMAVPTVISQLIVLIYNLADTYFVGQTNNRYMVAGVSLILPVFNLILAMGSLYGAGGGALLPKLLAAGRREEASRTAAYCLRSAALLALGFSAALLLFTGPILHLLGAGENTFGYARTYVLTVLVIGGLPTLLSNVLSNLLRSLGLSRAAGVGVALGGVLNLVLDPLFMFVLLPPGREVLGVGLATLLSNCIACSYCLWTFFRRQKEIVPLFLAPAPERGSVRAVYGVGIPGTVGTLLFDVDYMVLDRLASGYGDAALAAIGIVLKAERLPQQVGVGLCQGMVPLVAYSYARRDEKRVRAVMGCTLKIGLAVALVSVTVYQLFTPQIVRLFICDPETLAIGTGFLRVRSVAAVIMFFCFFVVFVYQGLGDGKRAMTLAVLRWAVLNIPMLFILNRLIGMYGLVWSQVVSDLLTVLVSYTMLILTLHRWKQKGMAAPGK